MTKIHSLATGRLLLRQWRPVDKAPFAALNADPEVMGTFRQRSVVPKAMPLQVASPG